jgi:hypothetical protein
VADTEVPIAANIPKVWNQGLRKTISRLWKPGSTMLKRMLLKIVLNEPPMKKFAQPERLRLDGSGKVTAGP